MNILIDIQARALRDAEQRLSIAHTAAEKALLAIKESEKQEKEIIDQIATIGNQDIVKMVEYKKARERLAITRHGLIRLRSYSLDRQKDIEVGRKNLQKAQNDFKVAEHRDAHKVIPFRRRNGQG